MVSKKFKPGTLVYYLDGNIPGHKRFGLVVDRDVAEDIDRRMLGTSLRVFASWKTHPRHMDQREMLADHMPKNRVFFASPEDRRTFYGQQEV